MGAFRTGKAIAGMPLGEHCRRGCRIESFAAKAAAAETKIGEVSSTTIARSTRVNFHVADLGRANGDHEAQKEGKDYK